MIPVLILQNKPALLELVRHGIGEQRTKNRRTKFPGGVMGPTPLRRYLTRSLLNDSGHVMSNDEEFVDDADDLSNVDHWEIYVSYIDDQPAVILVDLGIGEFAPLAEKPALVWVWVQIPAPDEEGFPTEEEDMKLNDVEDLITDAVEATTARYVGRITSNGRREFYFYTDNPQEFRDAATAAMGSAPDYQFEIDAAEDPDWEHYFSVLMPSPEDSQQIQNQHVIQHLFDSGDSLTEPRPVDHYLNFKTSEDRQTFITEVLALDFEVASQPERGDESEFPFALGLIRNHAVDVETVDDVTFELFELAQQHQGEYEGWGSKVVKSKN